MAEATFKPGDVCWVATTLPFSCTSCPWKDLIHSLLILDLSAIQQNNSWGAINNCFPSLIDLYWVSNESYITQWIQCFISFKVSWPTEKKITPLKAQWHRMERKKVFQLSASKQKKWIAYACWLLKADNTGHRHPGKPISAPCGS